MYGMMNDSNTDPLWLYEPNIKYEPPNRQNLHDLQNADTRALLSKLYEEFRHPRPSQSDMRTPEAKRASGPTQKEPPMSKNEYRTEAERIDDEVREAIAAPRRAAEIAKRIALVSTLESLANAEVGTVITFSKKLDSSDKTSTTFAAIKVSDDATWAVTGDGRWSNGQRRSFDSMLEWMTTGPNLVENVQKADSFSDVAAA